MAEEHLAFLTSLPNQAGWLERVIDEHPDFIAWRAAQERTEEPAES